MLRSALLAAAVLLALLGPGCAMGGTRALPEPRAEWVGGELRGRVAASPARLFSVAALVFQRMGMSFDQREQASDGGQLIVRMEDDRQVILRAERIASSRVSRIGLRVGVQGDENASRRLLDAILDELSS